MPKTALIKFAKTGATPEDALEHLVSCKYLAYDRDSKSLYVIRETIPEADSILKSLDPHEIKQSWPEAVESCNQFDMLTTSGNLYQDLLRSLDYVTNEGLYPTFILTNLTSIPDKVLGITVVRWNRPGITIVGSVMPFPVEFDVDMCVYVEASDQDTMTKFLFG